MKTIVVDAVMNEYDKTPPNVTKYRDMKLEMLAGTPMRGIGGLGEVAEPTSVTETLLEWQRKYLNKIQAKTANKQDYDEFSKVRAVILANGTDEQGAMLALMPYVQRVNGHGHFVFKSDFLNRVSFQPETIDEDNLSRDDEDTLLGIEAVIDNSPHFAGIDEVGGFYDEMSGLGKKFKDTKVGKALNKVGKALKKIAPPLVAARAAMLMVAKFNIKKYGHKLAIGYMSEAQAKAKGIKPEVWKKYVAFKDKAEAKFKKMGGNAKNLRKAVGKSKAAKKLGLSGTGIGEPVTLTVSAVAAAAIPIVVEQLKKMAAGSGVDGNATGLDEGTEENTTTASLDASDGFDNNEQRELANKATAQNPEPGSTETPEDKGNPKDGDDKKKNNTIWWVLGGGAALALVVGLAVAN